MNLRPVVVLLLVVAAPAFASQEAGPFAFSLTGKAFDERCVRVAAGESIRYRFRASAPIDFNIHYHRGKDVFYPVRRAAVRDASGDFQATEADDYCLMWEHAGEGRSTIEGTFEVVRPR